MAPKGDVSTTHHLLRSLLCCLEADVVMVREKSLHQLHQAFFPETEFDKSSVRIYKSLLRKIPSAQELLNPEALQTQLARPFGCRINVQGGHGLRPLG